MDEKDWVILQTVYEHENITKAAERLYTSQPALTYRLRQMEEELNVQLFRKNKRGLIFTPEGEYLVQYAKNMLKELQKTKDYIKNMNIEKDGIIQLGVSSNFAHYRLPTILKVFLEKYPNIHFNVITGWSSEIFRLIQNDKIQVAIISGDYQWTDSKVLLQQDQLCIISKKKLSIKDLPNLPRISYRSGPQIAKISYKRDPMIKKIIETWWEERFIAPPKISMEVDKVETCVEMVLHGLGYGIIPSTCLKPEHKLWTYKLTLNNQSSNFRNTWMLFKEQELSIPYFHTFINYVKETSQLSVSKG